MTRNPLFAIGAAAMVASTGAFTVPGAVFAQAFNVALGVPGTPPASSYAAAGLPGVWNDIGLTPIGQRVPLVGLNGESTGADLRQVGASGVFASNDPATSGDDEALLDSMVTSPCNPLDACYWIDGLENGEYIVTMYALTPNTPALLSSVRVDDATPGATLVGGAWTGVHLPGVSYMTFSVEVLDGEIGLHSGVPSSGAQAGLNGIQIRLADAVGSGTSSETRRDDSRLAAWPNPASGVQAIVRTGPESSGVLHILDVGGRIVRTHVLRDVGAGRAITSWDGRGENGTRVAPGVYFVRFVARGAGEGPLPDPAASPTLKLVRVE